MHQGVIVFIWLSILAIPSQAATIDEALAAVKAHPCKDNMNVEHVLDQSIRSHSQRDVGWRNFQEDGYVDVERAILVNKSMELRYRWRVMADNSIHPQTERAAKLFNSE